MNEAIVRNNLKITGTTNSAGGFFKDVKITGECQFVTDVNCEKFSLTGNSSVAGNLLMKQMKITGEVTLEGDLEGDSLRGQGQITAASIKVDKLHLTGNLDVNGDCEGETLQLSGALTVAGLLSAEHLEVSLYGPSKAKEVGGSKLIIKKSKAGKMLHLMKTMPKIMFEAEVIEGDIIELISTKANVVRGDQVKIGANCEIEAVEYRNTLEIHKSATVKHMVKL